MNGDLVGAAVIGVICLVISVVCIRHHLTYIDDELDNPVVGVWMKVPFVATHDGHPLSPAELTAVDHVITHQVRHLAEALHDAAMEHVYAQIAATEAHHPEHGLDAALTRIQNGAA